MALHRHRAPALLDPYGCNRPAREPERSLPRFGLPAIRGTASAAVIELQ